MVPPQEEANQLSLSTLAGAECRMASMETQETEDVLSCIEDEDAGRPAKKSGLAPVALPLFF